MRFRGVAAAGRDVVARRCLVGSVEGYETTIGRAVGNRFLLDRIPDYYERLKASYDERFYQQEVLGEYLDLHVGRVYFGYERPRNVAESLRHSGATAFASRR